MFEYILCAGPGQTIKAARYGFTLAHMCWQIGEGLELKTGSLGAGMREGYMVLGDALYEGGEGNDAALIDSITRECNIRGFNGVLCDFEKRVFPSLLGLLTDSVPYLKKRGIEVIVPESYAHSCEDVGVIVSTAMMSGSLYAKLSEATQRYGRRVSLEIECIKRDITLPDRNGRGISLNTEELDQMLEDRGGVSFYSQEMCARYFTYKDNLGNTHFCVFDDVQTLKNKTQTAMRFGIGKGFILFNESEEFLSALKD